MAASNTRLHDPAAARRDGAAALAGPVDRAERLGRIEQSHLRSAALGLSRGGEPDFAPLLRSDLTVARERNQRLFTHAAPVMELLAGQIVDTGSMILLTDAHGTILHTVGDDEFLARAGKVALAPGVNWAETSKGTNAIGTALFEERPTLVHGGEHFMHANSFLTCSAAPIFDPHGNMLGVLDVTGDQRSYHGHTMGLVRMSARMIENHWLSDDCGDRLRLHFHSRPEFIGTLLEGIVVVGADGRLTGANRSALDQLGLSSAALRMQSLAHLFGCTPGMLHDHVRAPLAAPLVLRLPDGRQVHVSARFNGGVRSLMAGLGGTGGEPPMRTSDGNEVLEAVAAVPAADRQGPAARADRADPTNPTNLASLASLATGDAQVDIVLRKVQRVLDRDIPLLILGETGTGKELLARAVHHASRRAPQPFVAVNCASIPEALIEAELFGYEDGAFTGARRKGAVGRIVQAQGGTLFLDEIGDMPLPLQARLLRVLQERAVTPLGSARAIPVDIALVSATHRPLRDMIEAGTFREDLYYRLNGLVVRLPALRERSDLAVIAQRILQAETDAGWSAGLNPGVNPGRTGHAPVLGADVMALFESCTWPGNIRQLANVLRTAAAMAAGEPQIRTEHLSDDFLEDLAGGRLRKVVAPAPPVTAPPAAGQTLDEAERGLVHAALEAAGGNISEAAKRLGVSRNTIYRKLKARAA